MGPDSSVGNFVKEKYCTLVRCWTVVVLCEGIKMETLISMIINGQDGLEALLRILTYKNDTVEPKNPCGSPVTFLLHMIELNPKY